MTNNQFKTYRIEKLPFIYKALKKPENDIGIPDNLPFALYVDQETGVFRQEKIEGFDEILQKVYYSGSEITGMMDDEGIGREYAEDFLKLLKKNLAISSFNNKKVLDIGCGTGFMLYLLKQDGAEVIGVEPGNHCIEGSRKYNVDIINEFFPNEKIKDKFDIIIMYGVLEHIEDSKDFLVNLKNYLDVDGKVAIIVQDEEPYIDSGEVSMLFHEHFSYFTGDTLKNFFIKTGYKDIKIDRSDFSNLLYCQVTNSLQSNEEIKLDIIRKNYIKFNAFIIKIENLISNVSNFINDKQKEGKEIGIYCPSRGINLLVLSGIKFDNIRFFDDNKSLYKTYFPGINVKIESRKELLEKNVDFMIIMSITFGNKIKKMLEKEFPNQKNYIISDFFEK